MCSIHAHIFRALLISFTINNNTYNVITQSFMLPTHKLEINQAPISKKVKENFKELCI